MGTDFPKTSHVELEDELNHETTGLSDPGHEYRSNSPSCVWREHQLLIEHRGSHDLIAFYRSPVRSHQHSKRPSHFKVGQTVKVGDTWLVTVRSVKTSSGDQFDQPHAGHTFLLIDISLKNMSSSEQLVSSAANFTLRDSSGQEITETVTTFAPHPPDGKVEAGA